MMLGCALLDFWPAWTEWIDLAEVNELGAGVTSGAFGAFIKGGSAIHLGRNVTSIRSFMFWIRKLLCEAF